MTTRGNYDDPDRATDADERLASDVREPIAEARSASMAGTRLEDEATSAGGEGISGPVEPDSPEAIRTEIDQTREEVAGTLDQIGERLDPSHLADQAKERVRGATIGRVETAVESAGETARGVGDMVFETIKRNPIPAALAGVGLALLWKNRADGRGRGQLGGSDLGGSALGGSGYRYTDRYGYTAGEYGAGTRFGGSQLAGTPGYTYTGTGEYQGTGPGVTDRARQAAGTVAGAAGSAADTVGQTAGQVADSVGRTAGQVAEGSQQFAGEALQRGQQAADQIGTGFNDVLRSNPLGVTVAALGAGAAIGLLIPETEPEHRILGPASDEVGRTIQQTASQTMDKVEEAAGDAERKFQEAQAG